MCCKLKKFFFLFCFIEFSVCCYVLFDLRKKYVIVEEVEVVFGLIVELYFDSIFSKVLVNDGFSDEVLNLLLLLIGKLSCLIKV